MREMIVAFIIALAIGSVMNQMNVGASDNHQTQGAGQDLITELDAGNFQGIVLDSKEPVLVDFYTTWCGPCKEMVPIMGNLAVRGQGKLNIARVDCDKNKALAEKYEIDSYPTFVLFQQGQIKDRSVGGKGLDEMRAWLKLNQIEIPSVGTGVEPTAPETTQIKDGVLLNKPSPEG